MKPTRISVLVVLAVVAGGIAYVVTRTWYVDIQSPSLFAPIWLLLLAAAEAYTASMTKARLLGRSGTKPINPIVVARLVALAKASSPVGALAFGAWTGFLVHVARIDSTHAREDTRTAAVGLAASLALIVAALAIERVCRVRPRPPDDDDEVAG
jgi:hypothetical protein